MLTIIPLIQFIFIIGITLFFALIFMYDIKIHTHTHTHIYIYNFFFEK